jgi:hypothetical protein
MNFPKPDVHQDVTPGRHARTPRQDAHQGRPYISHGPTPLRNPNMPINDKLWRGEITYVGTLLVSVLAWAQIYIFPNGTMYTISLASFPLYVLYFHQKENFVLPTVARAHQKRL